MSKTLNGTTRDVPHPRTTDSKEEKNPRIETLARFKHSKTTSSAANFKRLRKRHDISASRNRRNLSLLEGKAEDGRGDGVEEKGRIKMKSWKAIKDIFIGGINYEKEDYR